MTGSRTQARGASRRRLAASACLAVAALALAAYQPGDTSSAAGNGSGGTSGDSGVATAATLTAPGPMVATSTGFYVGDTTDCVIRMVDSSGNISTVAGQAGNCGNSGDGGLATNAQIKPLGGKFGLARDAAGDLYFAQDSGSGTPVLREVSADGTIRTPAVTYSGGLNGLASDDDGVVYLLDRVISWVQMPSCTPVYTTGCGTTQMRGGGYLRTLAADDTTTVAFTFDDMYLWEGLAASGHGEVGLVGHSAPSPGPWIPFRIDLPGGTSGWTSSTSGGPNPFVTNGVLAIAGDGTVYAQPSPDVTPSISNKVQRFGTDGNLVVIAGTGTADPATTAQSGTGTALNLTPAGLTITPSGSLLIASGHVVYRLEQAGKAPAPTS